MANHRAKPARPSRRAFRALSRAGYIVQTGRRGSRVVGRTVKQKKRFFGYTYTTRHPVYWKKK